MNSQPVTIELPLPKKIALRHSAERFSVLPASSSGRSTAQHGSCSCADLFIGDGEECANWDDIDGLYMVYMKIDGLYMVCVNRWVP